MDLNSRVFALSMERGHIPSPTQADDSLDAVGVRGDSISEHRDRSDREVGLVDLRHVLPLSELSPEQLAGIPDYL
jgi:hypothetical protein